MAKRRLQHQDFADCVLITPWNDAVFAFATTAARNFAFKKGAQLFWVQAADAPPPEFSTDYTPTQLENMKKRWLQYNSRKTGDVLSLLPCCFDMPFRITHRGNDSWKQHGVYKGGLCRFKGFQFDDADEEWDHQTSDNEIILKALPKKMYVHMDTPLVENYEGLPQN